MQADGVERAVAFTQYPQFSCSTTGSSLNELWRAAARTGLRAAFEWSVIDRWPVHPGFIDAMTETVRDGLGQFDPADREKALILFSAHSLPLDVIDRGDAYPQEVGASVQRVVEQLAHPTPTSWRTSRMWGRCGGLARAPRRSSAGWALAGIGMSWLSRLPLPATTSRPFPSSIGSTVRWHIRPGSPTTSGPLP